VSSLAAAEAVMSRQQKEAGTVLLDIGAGTTNVIVVEDGEVQHVAVLPMGGQHITNDLAIGLKTDLDVAEKVKLEHATLGKATKTTANVSIDKITHSFPMDDVQMIVEARVEELFEYVDKELQKIRRARKLPGGAIITGGTSKLPGIAELAKEKLQLPARVGKLQADIGGLVDTVEDASFSSVIGLMLLDMLLLPEAPSAQGGGAKKAKDGALGLVEGLLKRFKS
jgi:cell division protein FtsA